jgi:hypothetical protein
MWSEADWQLNKQPLLLLLLLLLILHTCSSC